MGRKGYRLESVKKVKFDHTTKWYMHKPVSVREKETHRILCDFEIQMAHLISTRQLDAVDLQKKGEKKERVIIWIFRSWRTTE